MDGDGARRELESAIAAGQQANHSAIDFPWTVAFYFAANDARLLVGLEPERRNVNDSLGMRIAFGHDFGIAILESDNERCLDGKQVHFGYIGSGRKKITPPPSPA